jgi:hypothetical protein
MKTNSSMSYKHVLTLCAKHHKKKSIFATSPLGAASTIQPQQACLNLQQSLLGVAGCVGRPIELHGIGDPTLHGEPPQEDGNLASATRVRLSQPSHAILRLSLTTSVCSVRLVVAASRILSSPSSCASAPPPTCPPILDTAGSSWAI